MFSQKLQENFGPHDPEADAENELEALRMKDGQRITKYIVDFQRLAVRVQWGDAALRHQFYKGLPARIKDEIARVGKPARLEQLKLLSQSIDARYWERRNESSREAPQQAQKPASARPAANSGGNPPSSKSDGTKTSDASSAPAKASPLQDKLGKDRKLTPQERQHRLDNKLCLFCSKDGHMAKDCPKSSSNAVKGRAAEVSVEAVVSESEN